MSNATRFVLRVILCLAAALVAFPSVVRANSTCLSETIPISSLSSGVTIKLPPSSAGECVNVTITGATLVTSGEALSSLTSPSDVFTAVNGGGGILICFASGADVSLCPTLSSPGRLGFMKLTKNGQWEIGTLGLRTTNGQGISIRVESEVSTGADHFTMLTPEPGSLILLGTGLLALARKLMA